MEFEKLDERIKWVMVQADLNVAAAIIRFKNGQMHVAFPVTLRCHDTTLSFLDLHTSVHGPHIKVPIDCVADIDLFWPPEPKQRPFVRVIFSDGRQHIAREETIQVTEFTVRYKLEMLPLEAPEVVVARLKVGFIEGLQPSHPAYKFFPPGGQN